MRYEIIRNVGRYETATRRLIYPSGNYFFFSEYSRGIMAW